MDKIEYVEEEEPKNRKVFVIILSIILLILVLTYFLTSPTVRNVIAGLIESSKIKENIVNINETNKLTFEKGTYNKLIAIYDNNPEREFKACLMGEVENGDYYIDEIYEPIMYLQEPDQVVSEPCPVDSLVSMHSHPLKHCLPSGVDLNNFKIFKERNPNALMAVMCERGRFNFYS